MLFEMCVKQLNVFLIMTNKKSQLFMSKQILAFKQWRRVFAIIVHCQKLHVVKSESLQGTDEASGWLTKISDKRT